MIKILVTKSFALAEPVINSKILRPFLVCSVSGSPAVRRGARGGRSSARPSRATGSRTTTASRSSFIYCANFFWIWYHWISEVLAALRLKEAMLTSGNVFTRVGWNILFVQISQVIHVFLAMYTYREKTRFPNLFTFLSAVTLKIVS